MKDIQRDMISENRKNYSNLFQDYQKIDRYKNIRKRIRKNTYKCSMQIFLGILIFDVISYLISALCFFPSHNIPVIIYWIILALITMFFFFKNVDKLDKYQDEMIRMRDEELCEILSKNNVDFQKITNVIEYFKLKLEPINEVHKEYPILNSISSFGTNLISLISGIIVSSYIKENLFQNGVKIYAIAIVFLILIIIVCALIKIYIYLDRKDEYADQSRKLIIDLKRIELLSRII